MLKASLHIHIQGDPKDYIRHTGFELIDRAHKLGYEVLAITCHRRVVMTPELQAYAEERNILLIPGVELECKEGDVVILNAPPEIELLDTLDELRGYKMAHPEILIMAPHPFFPGPKTCLQKKLHKYIDVFDAIEHCWMYSSLLDFNKKAEQTAKKHNLPLIATSDIHILDQINGNHVLIDADKNIESILEALRRNQFKSVAQPKGTFQMFWDFGRMNASGLAKYLPWTPPHQPFQHEKLHRKHKTKSRKRSTKISFPRRVR